MITKKMQILLLGLLVVLICSAVSFGITKEDYKRADALSGKLRGLVYKDRVSPNWLEGESKFWYRNDLKDGAKAFVLVDAAAGEKKAAFDHSKLAVALNGELEEEYSCDKLPFNTISFADNSIEFKVGKDVWSADLGTYELTKLRTEEEAEAEPATNRGFGRRRGAGFTRGAGRQQRPTQKSPDGKWEVYTEDYDLYIRDSETGDSVRMTTDGNKNYYYEGRVTWSADSKKFVTNVTVPAEQWQVHYVESSPRGQLQPRHEAVNYEKPGDKIAISKPCLFNVETKKQLRIDDEQFPSPYYRTGDWHWKPDSSRFYFYYNERGHQVNRVLAVDGETAEVSVIINEEVDTFIDYAAKKYLQYLDDTNEIIWASERDGWSHLYLYDMESGEVKNKITEGDWVWRSVDKLDVDKREIWFQANGYYSDQDPYFMHYFRVGFDGSGLVALTEGDGTHSIAYSPDGDYFIDTYSRVDMPGVTELRNTSTGKLVVELERGDDSELVKAGWQRPEPFVCKSRDDKFDIWGVIFRPTNYDPEKKYPVIEDIYAGPQGSFVPKSWSGFHRQMTLAEIGFIVVQIDGMGTSNRARDFHHFSAKNLGDGGFDDRIKWMKAAAKKYPYIDVERVGVYGTSAGGQSSTGALLFKPEFYDVGVSSCGCHDNRIDKLWWNELWMGYPIGPHYAEQSNVTNAHKLQGHLFLIVGEMDKNVDPASTMQVVDALIKANKDFDLLVVPGMGHSAGGAIGERKRRDFFVRHLLGEETPDWNKDD